MLTYNHTFAIITNAMNYNIKTPTFNYIPVKRNGHYNHAKLVATMTAYGIKWGFWLAFVAIAMLLAWWTLSWLLRLLNRFAILAPWACKCVRAPNGGFTPLFCRQILPSGSSHGAG